MMNKPHQNTFEFYEFHMEHLIVRICWHFYFTTICIWCSGKLLILQLLLLLLLPNTGRGIGRAVHKTPHVRFSSIWGWVLIARGRTKIQEKVCSIINVSFTLSYLFACFVMRLYIIGTLLITLRYQILVGHWISMEVHILWI